MFKNKILQVVVIYFVVFILYGPLISKINFYQNDDFYYYEVVQEFGQGNFFLPDKIAPTFYLQGFLGLFWSYFFGIENLPFLTLAISIATAALFNLILVRNSNLTLLQTVLISSILFFNPFFQYSIVGFMTDNYLLLTLVGGAFFYYEYSRNPRNIFLGLIVLISVGGFLIRQTALVLPAALTFYFWLNRKYKASLILGLTTLGIFLIYSFIFPQTPEMKSKSFEFENLLKIEYLYALVLGVLFYLGSFLFPFLSFLNQTNFKKLLSFGILTISLFWLSNYFYKPMEVAWGEFPFFENTFERTGFLPRELDGTKYYFRGNFDLYTNWEVLGKIATALGLALLIIKFRKLNLWKNFNFIFCIVYLGLMLLVEKFFDRYLLPLIVSSTLLMFDYLKNRKFILINYLIFSSYFVFMGYFSYFLIQEFVVRNNLIWTTATEMKVEGSSIKATRPWNFVYNLSSEPEYIFSYSNPKLFQEKYPKASLEKSLEVKYFLNPFIESEIFLYKINR